MEPDRGDKNSLAAASLSEPKEPSALPAITAKADDLEEIKKSVEDAASVSGGLWLSYLFVLSYIAIAAGAVTHEDLLLVRPVKLPFLNVELPLKAFFALAPFVVLIIHAYALMHFIMLGKKASRFHNELRRQFPDQQTETQRSGAAPEGAHKEIRDKLRRLLPSNIFVQILAGPPELRTGIFGSMLKLIALTTLVVFPILLLLLLQIQFLPFHDVTITWAQRIALVLDIVLMWLLRPPILADLSVESFGRSRNLAWVVRGFGLVLAGVMSIAAIWFSIVEATIPGEWRMFPLSYVAAIEPKTVNNRVFGVVDPRTHSITGNWPSNTLRLQGFDIYEALKVDDPKKLDWKDHTFDLHSRQLESAVFVDAKLGKVDLKGANLEGAWLLGAKLQGASLEGAELQGALLTQAQLEGASLEGAGLQGASFEWARLQGASLEYAQLQGASLNHAHLQGASLDQAQLQGASFEWAQLQSASLNNVEVNATNFSGAFLWRTNWGEIDPVKFGAVQLKNATWQPVWGQIAIPFYSPLYSYDSDRFPWDAKAFEELWGSMKSIPEGKFREYALKGIERLDCGNPEKTLASCDPAAAPPPDVLESQKKLARASVDQPAYTKALATELRGLVCASDANAIHILRGIIREIYIGMGAGRLAETGREAPALVDFIMSKDCPVSASLTDDDKAKLLKIKQGAEKKFALPKTSIEEK